MKRERDENRLWTPKFHEFLIVSISCQNRYVFQGKLNRFIEIIVRPELT